MAEEGLGVEDIVVYGREDASNPSPTKFSRASFSAALKSVSTAPLSWKQLAATGEGRSLGYDDFPALDTADTVVLLFIDTKPCILPLQQETPHRQLHTRTGGKQRGRVDSRK